MPFPESPSERIAAFLRGRGIDVATATTTLLAGDASTRCYARVTTAGGSEVLALYPERTTFANDPFVSVQARLSAMPVPVPAILGWADDLGIMAIEDLGDVTLQAYLGGAGEPERQALYRDAVMLIATLQRRGADLADDTFGPYRLAFDVEKLRWELDFFTTHYIEGYLRRTIPAADREALAREYLALADELASEPRVLCHRDYHSRNLMVHDGRLIVIDFQDARMGPSTYDLVSLLRDAYVELAEAEVDRGIATFLAARGRAEDPATFRDRFETMTIQRTLKALGTFGHQATVRANAGYVRYMPRTWQAARAALARQPRRAALATLLDRYGPGELGGPA